MISEKEIRERIAHNEKVIAAYKKESDKNHSMFATSSYFMLQYQNYGLKWVLGELDMNPTPIPNYED